MTCRPGFSPYLDFVMDVGKAIIDGTKDVFSTMLMVDLEHGEPIVGSDFKVESNLTSMLGLGKDIKGMLAVHCPEIAAKAITGSFLGLEVAELNEDVKDAVGEVANMVAGYLKIFFQEYDKNIELAIPTTIIGKSFSIAGMSNGTRVVVPFTMDTVSFSVELKYEDLT